MSQINASGSRGDENIITGQECSTQPHDIIVIHGFGTKSVYHAKDALEDWITSEAHKKNLKTHCYAFDATRLFIDKDTVWEKECNKLRRWLNHLYVPDSLATQQDVTQGARTKEDQRNGSSLRPLLFVAHGLAAWVLKKVLSAQNSNIDSRLIAIIYLDGPETSPKLDNNLQRYVKYSQRFTNKLYKPLVDRSSDTAKWPLSMIDTDRRFLRYLDRYQEDMEVSSMVQKSFRLWLYEDSLPDIRKCGRSGWKSLASRLANRLSKTEFSDNLANVFDPRNSPEPPAGPGSVCVELNTDQRNDDRSSTISGDNPRNWDTFSIPRRESLDDQQIDQQGDYVSRTYELATIYFNRSELSYAENLFLHCFEEMSNPEPPYRGQIQVLMQIMSVRMFLGKYDKARKDLNRLRSMIEDTKLHDESKGSQARLLCDWDRWEAIWNLRTGNWPSAAKILEDLKISQTQSLVEVQRDLALTYAYMGNIDQATVNIKLASSTLRGTSPDAKDVRQRVRVSGASTVKDLKQESIRMTEAEIHLSAGRYSLALDEAAKALSNLTRILGSKHLKTLSVANIKSLALAYCSQYREAEGLCLTTLDVIVQELSRKHPLFFQAMATLVYIFRCQNRFAEAIDTGKALYEQVSMRLKEKHPYTLRAGFQLGAAYLANGDYSEALQILEKMMTFYGNSLQPDTLRYQLELSRAYFLVGKTLKAQQLALHVAIHQVQTDIPTTWTCEGPCTSRYNQCFAYSFSTEEALAHLAIRVKEIVRDQPSFRVHPYFTTTLQHLATMVVRVQKEVSQAELELVADIIRDVKSLNSDGDPINNTGDARLDFALALLLKEMPAQKEDLLGPAATLLRSVMKWRSRQLGGSHLETIRAYRELMVVYSMRALYSPSRDKPVDISLEEVEYRSLAILGSLESTLGLYHPETLQSRLWYFTVTLLISSHQRRNFEEEKVAEIIQEIYEEANTIVSRTRAPIVRRERYIEALKIEKTVFDLLLGAELVQERLGKFLEHSQNDLAKTIETNFDEDISLELQDLQGSFKELWHSYTRASGG